MKDEDLLSLLDHDEDVPVPAEHEAKIRAGLAGLLGPGAGGPGDGGGPSDGAASGAGSGTGTFTGVGAKWAVVIAMAAGGAGFVAGRATAPEAQQAAPMAAPSTTTSTTVAVEPSTPVLATASATSIASAAPSASATHASAGTAAGATGAPGFDREQSLLERARSALVRHDAAAAEAALDECERAFPQSRHAEERDYLRIQLLRERGDTARARERARAFLEKYPDSLLRGRVEPLTK